MKIQILILAALYPVCVLAQLPDTSAQLVKKLGEWELEREVALQKEIAEKRAAVMRTLQTQLIEATKAGDLNGALAIKAEIERLTPMPLSTEPKRNEVPGSAPNSESGMSKSKFAQELTKSKWQCINEKGMKDPNWTLEFMDTGKAKFWYGTHDYKVIEPFKIRVSARNDVPESIYTFSRDFNFFSTDTGASGERKAE